MHAACIEPRYYMSDCHQEKLAAMKTPRADMTLVGNMGMHEINMYLAWIPLQL